MEDEQPKEELSAKETETLDKIISKLLSVKKYLYLYNILSNSNIKNFSKLFI